MARGVGGSVRHTLHSTHVHMYACGMWDPGCVPSVGAQNPPILAPEKLFGVDGGGAQMCDV